MSFQITSWISAAGIPGGSNYAPGDLFTIDVGLLAGEHYAEFAIDTVRGSDGVALTFHQTDPGCAGYSVTGDPDGDSVTIVTGVNAGLSVNATWFTLSVAPCSGGGSGYVNRSFHAN